VECFVRKWAINSGISAVTDSGERAVLKICNNGFESREVSMDI